MLTSNRIVDTANPQISVTIPPQKKAVSTQTVILDPHIEDLSLLLDGLRSGVQAYVLTKDGDGVEQITAFLQQNPSHEVTLIAHGFPGGLRLGASTLALDTLDQYAQQLRQWFTANKSANLTLMACNVGQGEAGQALIHRLSEITSASIIASAQVLGNGNWLQSAKTLFTPETLDCYSATLNWTSVGPELISQDIPNEFDIEVNSQGTPYILYRDGADNEKLTVQRFDGTSWVNVGVPGFPGGSAFGQLEFDSSDTPYVFFRDGQNNSRGTVMKFDGINWVYVGQPGFSGGGLKDISMTFFGDTPYVAYTDRTRESRMTVRMFDGTDWVVVGDRGFSSGLAEAADVNVDGNGIPYVAYLSESGGTNRVTVQRFTGGQWNVVGTEGFSLGAESYAPDIEFDNNNVPYVVYRARGNGEGNKAIVETFNGTDWVQAGNSAASSAGGFQPDLEFDNNGVAYVAIVDQAEKDKVSVRVLEGNTWADFSDDGFSIGPTNFPDLEFDVNNIPYVLYRETFNRDGTQVDSAAVKRLGDPPAVVDETAPVLVSIRRKLPLGDVVNAGPVIFEATFSEAVTNVGPEDFVINGLPGATIGAVTAVDGSRYEIVVNPGDSSEGTVGLDLAQTSDITDIAGNGLTLVEPTTDEVYTYTTAADEIAPTLASIRRKDPLADVVNAGPVIFEATFSEAVTNVGPEDFVMNGLPGATIGSVTDVDGGRYEIAVNLGDASEGTIGLDLAQTSDIADIAGNGLTLVEPTVDEIYTVTAPIVPIDPPEEVDPPGEVDPPEQVDPPAVVDQLTILSEANRVEVTELGDSNTLQLTLLQGTVSGLTSFTIFGEEPPTAGAGETIGQFSLLNYQELGIDVPPRFTIDGDLISVGQQVQFAIADGNTTLFATPSRLSDSEAVLDFSNGLSFKVALATETVTTNLLTNDAEAIDLTAQSGPTAMRFSVYREAEFNNTVDFYTTDFVDGGIIVDDVTGQTLRPGEAGYEAAAIANRLNLNLSSSNGQVNTVDAPIANTMYLGIFMVVDGVDPATNEVVFSHSGANTNGNDHIKLLGDNTFGIEDQANLGDRDFNDVVVEFSIL
ncbi:MAG: DUF4347 domain-containing protein [Cyanobacteria bacterium J06642_11]